VKLPRHPVDHGAAGPRRPERPPRRASPPPPQPHRGRLGRRPATRRAPPSWPGCAAWSTTTLPCRPAARRPTRGTPYKRRSTVTNAETTVLQAPFRAGIVAELAEDPGAPGPSGMVVCPAPLTVKWQQEMAADGAVRAARRSLGSYWSPPATTLSVIRSPCAVARPRPPPARSRARRDGSEGRRRRSDRAARRPV